MHRRIFDISSKDTRVLKGVAIMMMLWHHLFLLDLEYFRDITIHGYALVNGSARVAKVCVAVFVFLSGYGLTRQHLNKRLSVGKFYKKRLKKLFFNYWLIWLLFVPAGFLFFGYTMEDVFGDYPYSKCILQLTGLHHFFLIAGFNDTWWFYTCIIFLYLLFPFLNALSNRWLLFSTFVALLMVYIHVPIIHAIRYYVVVFIIGMWMARFSDYGLKKGGILTSPLFWITVAAAFAFFREFTSVFGMERADFILAPSLVMIYKTLETLPMRVTSGLLHMGEHSNNMYLFHAFIYRSYFHGFIYWSGHPVVIFLTLLSVCLMISTGIEEGKNLLRIPSVSTNKERKIESKRR